jgi:hypothetical protein
VTEYDAWLLKTDANGDTLWTKTFVEDSLFSQNEGNSVQQTIDGGYIICGSKDFSVWLIKTDTNGDTLWTKTFVAGRGNSVQQTNDGGYIVIGIIYYLGSDVWVLRTDANGDTLWTKTFGDSGNIDQGNSVQLTNDGGYIIAGAKGRLVDPTPVADVWLIKVAPEISSIGKNRRAFINDYRLQQNYPNPFNPTTTIEFSLPQSGFVTLKIYNILGEEVTTLVSDKLSAGSYSYEWSGTGSLASGVYLYRLETDRGFSQTLKLILLK